MDGKYIKLLYFITSLQFFIIYQFKSNIATEIMGLTVAQFAILNGWAMIFVAVINVLNSRLFDKINRPGPYLICNLIGSSICLRVLFYVKNRYLGFLFYTLYHIFYTPQMTFCDRIAIEHMERKDEYGTYKYFETIGYLCNSFIVEYLLNNYSDIRSNLLLYEHIVTLFSVIYIFSFFKKQLNIGEKKKFNFFVIFKIPKIFYFFIFTVLLNGIVRMALSQFISKYFRDILNLSKINFSNFILKFFNRNPIFIVTICSSGCEMLALRFSPYFLRQFNFYIPYIFASLIQTIRCSIYCLIRPGDPLIMTFTVTAIEFLKGIIFGCLQCSGMQLALYLTDSENVTTVQMIFSNIFTVGSVFFSSIFIGTMIEDNNINSYIKFFFTCGSISILSCFISIIIFYRYIFK